MKNPLAQTALFLLAAVALVVAAARIQPDSYEQAIFSDQGEPFFPDFRDVTDVKAIEVIAYNEADATARPLKVEFRKGHWVIASHNDYPAEARDSLTKTSAALLDLKRDIVVSDLWEDQAKYGVIDPLDSKNASLTGRGKRITLRDAQGGALVDIILGKPVEGREGFRYARLPGAKRIYAVKTDADPSAQFADWVEPDLLSIRTADIARMVLTAYQIDEFGRLANVQRTEMVPDKQNWNAKARTIAATLGSLRVVGALHKPPSLADQLRSRQLEMTIENVMSLRQTGFYITPDGRLLANDGELGVETKSGISYTIRFGQVAQDASDSKAKDSRYLFVTASSAKPESQERAKALDAKFADWYYMISGDDFNKLRPDIPESAVRPTAPAPAPAQPPGIRTPGVQ